VCNSVSSLITDFFNAVLHLFCGRSGIV